MSDDLVHQLGLFNMDIHKKADKIDEILAEIDPAEKKETKLISEPSRVKSVILVPNVVRVVSLPKKALDIQRRVARVVREEVERQKGRV